MSEIQYACKLWSELSFGQNEKHALGEAALLGLERAAHRQKVERAGVK